MKQATAMLMFAAMGCGLSIVRAADLKQPAVAPLAPVSPAAASTAPAAPTAATNDVPKAATSAAPAAKSLPNPTVNASVVDWAIFVADASKPEFNARELFRDPLPPLIEDLRTARPVDKAKPGEPGPIGVIRVAADGPLDAESNVDIQLSYKNGRALGHWPKAKVRSSGLLWQDLHLAPKKGEPRSLPEGSWLAGLRSSGLPLLVGSVREPFLLYDIELNYPQTIQVTGKEGKYSVASGMDAPLRDFTLYKRTADGHWQTATLETLKKAAGLPAAAPAAKPDDKPKPTESATVGAATAIVRQVVAGGRIVTTSTAAGATTPTTAAAATTPALPAGTKGTDISLGPSGESDATVLATWRAKLSAAGLSSSDQDLALKILGQQVLDSKRLTAVYRIDSAELDRLLPLEVVPQPKKVSRIALVVVTGIDPAIGDELDDWIKKLGDPSWKTREAATTEIKKLGSRAKAKLEAAAKNSDTEIAYRAEQLLATLGTDGEQPNANANGAVQVGGFF